MQQDEEMRQRVKKEKVKNKIEIKRREGETEHTQ